MTINTIKIRQAKVHNLKNVDLDIPKNSFTVITGPSGSGKSSLAFDTIFVEGQRKYIESLSSYARQFLGQFPPPDVESISGLSPTIAINQKTTSRNPRSTVGTTTEIYDYLRILFARLGTPFCPNCKGSILPQLKEEIISKVSSYELGTKLEIMAPITNKRKGEFTEEFAKFYKLGFIKAIIDGVPTEIHPKLKLKKTYKHDIAIVIDRIILKSSSRSRLASSIELALKFTNGHLLVKANDAEHFYSENSNCRACDLDFPEITPQLFSFNSPIGACSSCKGLGVKKSFSKESVLIDDECSIDESCFGPIVKKNSFFYKMLKSVAKKENINLTTPFQDLSETEQNIILNGNDTIYSYRFKSDRSSFNFKKIFPGLLKYLDKRYHESESDRYREILTPFLIQEQCSSCNGEKLTSFARNILIDGQSIFKLCELSTKDLHSKILSLSFSGDQKIIANKLNKEIISRLKFLLNVGLSYLSLNRTANTLSGGESQRIRLATQVGSALTGVTYVLDEPSIGLHQSDNTKLIKTLKDLKDIGNTVIVVEHDEETIWEADYLVDMGPKAGISGGEVIASGKVESVLKSKRSLTADYMAKRKSILLPEKRRIPSSFIEFEGINKHNISDLDIKIPLGILTCITGVSGSGKSTLLHNAIIPALKGEKLKKSILKKMKNGDMIQSLIEIDQKPIGKTPKSNPATYTGAFDHIRQLYSLTEDAQIRGYRPGRFSFNVKDGRCQACDGNGIKKIEMHFLPDVEITCNTCNGKRYNSDTLQVYYKEKNIADLLNLTAIEALEFFENHKRIKKIFETLCSVGLGYIKLGQPATTLSGGESQRLKLAKELSKSTKGHCLYVLDEPTTGLHLDDINHLLNSLQKLVDNGHSMIIIEHNLDIIKCADYILDMGPTGGADGGKVVAQGTPETIAQNKKSLTGSYLKKLSKIVVTKRKNLKKEHDL